MRERDFRKVDHGAGDTVEVIREGVQRDMRHCLNDLAVSQPGSTRLFKPGDHFFSADTLPSGATFDPHRHGHNSRQVGDEPLVTAFVRA